jgi:hypothetical protein
MKRGEITRRRNQRLKRRKIMREILVLMLILLLSTVYFAQSSNVRPSHRLVFIHANLIDMTSERVKTDMTIVVKSNRIAEIGKFNSVKIPKNSEIIDASGKFLIPGLWDMHAHTRSDELTRKIIFPLDIANAVVGIRDMAGDCIGKGDCDGKSPFDIHLGWRRDSENGTLIAPRMIIGSAFVDGFPPEHNGSMVVTNAKEAREAVYFAKRRGIDFLKIYGKLSPESYFALAREAKKLGVDFAGHVPALIGAIEASNAGQKSEEHLFGVLTACSGQEADFIEARRKTTAASGFDAVYSLRSEQEKDRSYAKSDCSEFFHALLKNKTWMVPTYTYWRAIADFSFFDAPRLQEDRNLRYIPVSLTKEWTDMYATFIAETKEEDLVKSRRLFQERLTFVKRLHDAGVKILAGTDSDTPYTIPGFNLHDELKMFVAGGLTPFEALQTATINAAEYQNKLNSLGTIEKGKLADLVLLDENPLVDISSTRQIFAVVLNGRLLNRTTLDKMLADAETAAKLN